MSVIHIAEYEVAEKLPGLLGRVKAGDQVMIDTGSAPIVVSRGESADAWTADKGLARLAGRTLTVVDEQFAKELEEIREQLNASYTPSPWD